MNCFTDCAHLAGKSVFCVDLKLQVYESPESEHECFVSVETLAFVVCSSSKISVLSYHDKAKIILKIAWQF